MKKETKITGGGNGSTLPESDLKASNDDAKKQTVVREVIAKQRDAIGECITEINYAYSKLKELQKNFSPDSASYQACDQIKDHLTAASGQFAT